MYILLFYKIARTIFVRLIKNNQNACIKQTITRKIIRNIEVCQKYQKYQKIKKLTRHNVLIFLYMSMFLIIFLVIVCLMHAF